MTSEVVLLYRNDEHISSHIDEGQIDEQRIRRRGQKIKEPSKHIQYYLQVADYYSWYLENGKSFLVSVEVGNKWREDLRCSKHRQLTSEFGQSFEEQTDEPNFEGWPSSWNSIKDSSIHVSNNPWEQPSFGYVSEQPPMYGGSSSSQPAYTDDGGYIPQMDYTSITGSSFHPEQMQGTPPSMQMDDQWFNDEQTPDPPRRTVHPLNGTIKHHPYTDKNYREEDKK
ncbi:hypothetical protein V6N12_000199 [Hibiscus sabdariffa]|uniref:Uncharacterized protein n=1 Tax=Hibiscus sabdariffa TaxID=183260 RepID=A0ABR2ATN7_9ROSI